MSEFDQEGSAALAVLNEWFRARGHDVSGSTEDAWNVAPYRDAFIFSSGQGRRSNTLYLVRGQSVSPFSAAADSLEDAYSALD